MKSQFTDGFIKAVEDKDISLLRAYITESIYDDPQFTGALCDQYMKYIEDHGISITEPFSQNLSEVSAGENPESWTKELFYKKVEYLRMNFAYKERIEEIKKIGRYAFKDEKTEKKETSKSPFVLSSIVIGLIILATLMLSLYLGQFTKN